MFLAVLEDVCIPFWLLLEPISPLLLHSLHFEHVLKHYQIIDLHPQCRTIVQKHTAEQGYIFIVGSSRGGEACFLVMLWYKTSTQSLSSVVRFLSPFPVHPAYRLPVSLIRR